MDGGTAKRHAAGLDGIRGVAVAAITAYHLGLIRGGILSVTVFFTLSGYLITSILLRGVDLRTFWVRRARRLLPALGLLLVVVLAATSIARPSQLSLHAKQAASAALYVANWATIARGDNYFHRFSGPAPFDHLWSLAIEEQFYVVWPLVVAGMLMLSARRKTQLMLVTGVLAVMSTVWMAVCYVPHAVNNTRAYEGTDTRAAPILIGALAAMIVPLERTGEGGRGRRLVLEAVGLVALAVVVVVVARTDELSPFLYQGGEVVVALASAVLVVAAGHPSTWVGRALGVAPLRWLGERTYGIYLWHLPVVAFMPPSALQGRPVARVLVQVAAILALAALSWALLEDPIRRNGFRAAFSERALRFAGVTLLVPIATGALIVWPKLTPASARDLDPLAELAAETPEARPVELAAVPMAKAAPRTSCTQLVHLGDSTSLGLISKQYLPDPADRLDARYQSVGVTLFIPEISGGRSIVEKHQEKPSAYEVVAARTAESFKGCWVFALGTSDAATTLGNVPGLMNRIRWMMERAGGAPVLWLTNKTVLAKGAYRNAHMLNWNQALLDSCKRYPNMRVYDWASEVRDAWFLPDAIHPNEVGSRERAARVARALAVAFPHGGPPSAECVVKLDAE